MRILLWVAAFSYFNPAETAFAAACQGIIFVVSLVGCAVQDFKEITQ